MRRKIRSWLRRWIPKVISVFESGDRKGKWFEDQYYTYLFTRNRHYSNAQPNEEEAERWRHIEQLVQQALTLNGRISFKTIVDFGCGRGWLTKKLSAFGNVIGIEPISKVVEHGRKIYPGLDLRKGDVQTLKTMNADLLVCSEVVEHLGKRNLSPYFESFYQSIHTGGFLILTTPRQEAYADWSRHVELDQPTEEWLSEEEVRNFAEAAGFSVIRKIVYGSSPKPGVPKVDIYQQWLFRR